jgi:bifunctional DNA-binding transcriptional regulator/antitoxin component of YhaV-PrlF toxin-antitoxin module
MAAKERSVSDTKATSRIVRSARDGRITIPAEFRRALGIAEETPLRLTLADGELRMTPLRPDDGAAGAWWFKALYDDFAPARAEALAKGYTDDEINAWIDAAVAAVRAEHG